jgi:hypothetical protein
MRRRLVYTVVALVLASGAFASIHPATPFTAHPQETAQAAAPSAGATYYWHGYNVTFCPETTLREACSSSSWWRATAHVAFWANGTSAVMATGSGYPYCTPSGYNITIQGCSWHGGGSTLYVVIAWQNCIAPFNIGCFDDYATLTFNARGQYVGYVEDWLDGWQ